MANNEALARIQSGSCYIEVSDKTSLKTAQALLKAIEDQLEESDN